MLSIRLLLSPNFFLKERNLYMNKSSIFFQNPKNSIKDSSNKTFSSKNFNFLPQNLREKFSLNFNDISIPYPFLAYP